MTQPRQLAKPPPELVATFEAALPADSRVERKLMFGMPAAFVAGNMFTGLFESKMLLRLPPEKLREFMALSGAEAFEPMPGRPMTGYALVPDAVLADGDALASWLGEAFNYAAGLPAKEKKPGKPRANK